MSKQYPPQVVAAKLSKRVSKNGNEYLHGYLGQMRVVVLKSNETTDDGAEIYNLIFQQTEDRRPRTDAKPSPAERAKANEPPTETRRSRPMPNDAIPF